MLCDSDACVYYPDGSCYCPDLSEPLRTAVMNAALEAHESGNRARNPDGSPFEVPQAENVNRVLTKPGATRKIVIVVSVDTVHEHLRHVPRPAPR